MRTLLTGVKSGSWTKYNGTFRRVAWRNCRLISRAVDPGSNPEDWIWTGFRLLTRDLHYFLQSKHFCGRFFSASSVPDCWRNIAVLFFSDSAGNPVPVGERPAPTHSWRHRPVPLQRRGSQQNRHRRLLGGTVSESSAGARQEVPPRRQI